MSRRLVGHELEAPVVAVDAGQTGTRAMVISDDGHSSIGESAGILPIAARDAPIDVALRVAEAIGRAGGNSVKIATLCIGLSGFVIDDDLLGRLVEAIFASAPAKRLVLASDAVTSYLGALGDSAGIVGAVGTGLVVLGASGTGTWARVGGWGYLLDDSGSGFDVGRRGLEAVVRGLDGRSTCGPLYDAAMARFGGAEPLWRAVYGSVTPAAIIAAFAIDVLGAAAAGDPEADRIVDDAGRDIAAAMTAAWHRLFRPDDAPRAVLTGSMVPDGGLLFRRVGEWLAATGHLVLSQPLGTALDGAITLDSPNSRALFPGLILDFGTS